MKSMLPDAFAQVSYVIWFYARMQLSVIQSLFVLISDNTSIFYFSKSLVSIISGICGRSLFSFLLYPL